MTTSLTRRGILAAAPALAVAEPGIAQVGALRRQTLFATADDDVRLHVREVSPASPRGDPLILLHGARAPSVKIVSLSGPTHFAHLDRPERGRDRLLTELTSHFGKPIA